jgi:CubicO group peptidase (beta-lactamase class C family)
MTSQSQPSAEQSQGERSLRESGRFAAALRILEDAIAAHAFPGCAFGVLAGDDIVIQGALGRFTYEENVPAVAADTIYDVASLTKVVATTAAAMLLVQRGQLDLETPLGELLPGFVVGRTPEDLARTVTLRHLLAHNSGLPGYVEFFRTAPTPTALFHACFKLPLQAAPGTRAEYSDPGFILLGKALEALIGEDLATWTRREVFQPLGMAATEFCPSPAIQPTIPPTEEDLTFRHRRIQGEVEDENASVLNGVAGHAGLFSNVPDLLRFGRAILRSAKPAGSEENPSQTNLPLFDPAVLKQFAERQPPQANSRAQSSSRALGWDTPSEPSSSGTHFLQHSIGHLGYSGCSLWIDLDAAVAVVLLTNRTWPNRQNQSIREVRPLFHDAVRVAL